MLEKKHLVFLAGATAPFAPPLCTALKLRKRVQYLAPKALQFLKAKTNLFTILKLHNHFVRM